MGPGSSVLLGPRSSCVLGPRFPCVLGNFLVLGLPGSCMGPRVSLVSLRHLELWDACICVACFN